MRARSGSRSSSPTTTGPADDVPGVPGRRAAQGRLPVRRALRHRGRLEARAGAARRRTIRSSSGTSTSSRSRRSPTSCRSSTRTARSRCSGLRRLAQTQKPGLRALMRVAGVDPAAVDESSIGFRLAPRINASGRLVPPRGRARAAAHRGPSARRTQLAEELEGLNRERQAIEERILREAVAEVESWPEARRRRRGYVVAGEGWHEGVIGIVASRLVERYNRPVVLIAGTDGDWKGSGRSVPAFDLHAGARRVRRVPRALRRPSRRGRTDDRAEQSRDVRRGVRRPRRRGARQTTTCGRSTRVDAIVAGAKLTLGLCAELGRLAPFGLGNPGVTLLVDGCELADLVDGRRRQAPALPRAPARPRRRLGDRVRHGRRSSTASGATERYDVAFRLQENRWNGVVVAAARRPARLRRAPTGSTSCASWLGGAVEGGRGVRGRPRRARSSPSSSWRTVRAAACSSRRRSGRCSNETPALAEAA